MTIVVSHQAVPPHFTKKLCPCTGRTIFTSDSGSKVSSKTNEEYEATEKLKERMQNRISHGQNVNKSVVEQLQQLLSMLWKIWNYWMI